MSITKPGNNHPVLERLKDVSGTEQRQLLDFYKGNVKQPSLTWRSILYPLVDSEGDIALRFTSGNGAHYLFADEKTLKAVYIGPHGPENRPTPIDKENTQTLLKQSEEVSVTLKEDSQLNDPAIRTLIK